MVIVELGVKSGPSLRALQARHILSHTTSLSEDERSELKIILKDELTRLRNAPALRAYAIKGWWEMPDGLVEMEAEIQADCDKIDSELLSDDDNIAEREARKRKAQKAQLLGNTGRYREARAQFCDVLEETLPSGEKADILFAMLQLHIFQDSEDLPALNAYITALDSTISNDWSRRNRWNVYKGLLSFCSRDYKVASHYLVEALYSTAGPDLMDFRQYVVYATLATVLTGDRQLIKTKIINNTEVQKVLQAKLVKSNPNVLDKVAQNLVDQVANIVKCLHSAQYESILPTICSLCECLEMDPFLHLIRCVIFSNLKVIAFRQYMQPYISLKISRMALVFGISEEYLIDEIVWFVSAEKLPCKLDLIDRTINRSQSSGENKQHNYDCIIKQLLNSLHRLECLTLGQ